MPIPVNTRVSLSLHPAVVSAMDSYDEDTAPLLAGTVTAFTTTYEGVASMWAARDVVNQNGAWTEEKRIIEMGKLSDRKFATMAKSFDTAMDYLKKNIAMFERELTAPVTAKAAASVSIEIRNHAKDLPSGERNGFIQQALKDGDEVTLSALLGAPAYLSGLTADAQKVYLRQMHGTRPAKTAEIVVDCVRRDGTGIYAAALCGGCLFQFHGNNSAMRLVG